MRKHSIILNMSYNKIIFWPDYYQYVGALQAISKVKKYNMYQVLLLKIYQMRNTS